MDRTNCKRHQKSLSFTNFDNAFLYITSVMNCSPLAKEGADNERLSIREHNCPPWKTPDFAILWKANIMLIWPNYSTFDNSSAPSLK